ncbi:hypothetical protein Pla52n_42860 [Stieleria varia]|uniref:Uncharacterized protein n=1 Tax=Stieleria varia TaxID=2528005 RepID=A0A5C6AP77_9BACT|nr:hypothetical protein Pla52n_42860 [Stieleria varia]
MYSTRLPFRRREPDAIESVPLRKLIAPAIFLVFTSTKRKRVHHWFPGSCLGTQ